MPSRADPEIRAIKREVAIDTAMFVAALVVLLLGLVEAAFSLAGRLSAAFALATPRTVTFGLFVAFAGALAYVVWSGSRRHGTWSAHLKNVVPLSAFLTYDPAKRGLGPDLDQDSAAALLRNLQAIAAREDVTAVRVGLLSDEGFQSDRVLIKTFASADVIRQWSTLLQTEFQTISTRRYEINGKQRKVRSLLFVWA